jgi:hypothetical protein
LHGVVFAAYERFLGDRFGKGLADEVFARYPALSPRGVHPDAVFLELVDVGARLAQRSPDRLLREFGAQLIGIFHELYPTFFPSEGARRFLVQLDKPTAGRIREVVAGSSPPHLDVRDLGAGRLRIEYHSERNLCALLAGMLDGTGTHYQTPVRHREESCRRRGDPLCVFMVEVQQTLLPRTQRKKPVP